MADRAQGQKAGARTGSGAASARRPRGDAELNYGRIVEAAVRALRDDPEATIDQIAARGRIGRATIYRHFGSRAELVRVAERQAREEADANERDALRPPGELSGGPVPLNVADVLNKVPPHLVGEQIVAEVRRRGRVSSAALYLVDIDGSRLLRLAGSEEFPRQLPAPSAVGPELPRSGMPGLRREIGNVLPGVGISPLYLRGRAIGVLVALGAGEDGLSELARQAAAALELARPYTDALEMTRLHKDISPASEIQQNLLPPRIGRISGASVAGNVLPSYDVGGDWFDYVDNADGAWIGLADAVGVGPRAGALSSIALGAFRAARRSGANLPEAVETMDSCLAEVGGADDTVAALIGRWHGPTSTFSWINRGYPVPLVLTAEGRLERLEPGDTPPLGAAANGAEPGSRRLTPGERLLLCSDGVILRPRASGEPLGPDGIRAAAVAASPASASGTIKAIEQAVLGASSTPLEDDAALVVLVPVGPDSEPTG
jgi:serine phosphatase RsbU (regulator of sigma subunit)